jgi:hypothetical protein
VWKTTFICGFFGEKTQLVVEFGAELRKGLWMAGNGGVCPLKGVLPGSHDPKRMPPNQQTRPRPAGKPAQTAALSAKTRLPEFDVEQDDAADHNRA